VKAKVQERERAIELRRSGKSIRDITGILGVAKSSVSNWVRHIELTDQQQSVLLANQAAMGRRSCNLNSQQLCKKSLEVRRRYQDQGKCDAQRQNMLHALACMLYWGEGSKSRNIATISNADPHVIRVFVRCLKEFFQVPDCDIRLRIVSHLGNGVGEIQIRDFWVGFLNLSQDNVVSIKFDMDKRQRSGKRKKIHPFGICQVYVCSTELVQRIYGSIQEYGEFHNDTWLN
jgi:transposase-like protein